VWRPGRKPVAVLVALHGTQSHSGWYGDLATRLSAQGWAVYAPDRRSSGMNNPGTRKNLKPSPVDTKGCDQWLRDLDSAMAGVVEANPPGVPIYLMGSSWSTALCPAYVDSDPARLLGLRGWRPQHASAVDGIILSVPAGLESRRPGTGQRLRTIAFGITGQVLIPLRKLHEKIDLPAETYSRHPHTRTLVGDEDVAAHAQQDTLCPGQQDPLVVHRATYSFLLGSGVLRKAGKQALERLRIERPDFPILSVLAEVDDIAVEPGKETVVLPGAMTLPQTYHALQIERPDLLTSAILKWHQDRR
jgi:alpha-beta hydrolase superfamily lysophospholipase